MASPHLLLYPHWVTINTLKTVREHSYHFHARTNQPTQNTLTWTQEKASGEAEVLETHRLKKRLHSSSSNTTRGDARSSPQGGAHNQTWHPIGGRFENHTHYWFYIHVHFDIRRCVDQRFVDLGCLPGFKRSPWPLRFCFVLCTRFLYNTSS